MSWKNFFVFGLTGMLLDLDHLIPALRDGVPISEVWEYMTLHGVRDLHIPALLVTLMIFIYCWANEPEKTDE